MDGLAGTIERPVLTSAGIGQPILPIRPKPIKLLPSSRPKKGLIG
jgi:hypothetical protein